MSERASNRDELDEIRRRKREALEAKIRGEGASEDDSQPAPTTPVRVDGVDEFESLVAAHDVVLVDFHADWCGPCKMLEPTVKRLAAETDATVAKVDADRNQTLAQRHGVRGLPTLLLFSGGDVVEQVVGVRDYGTLRSLVDQYV
ncbi:thioredoxin family protein [Halogeometricum limi]|uniref:Thioredoxin n=1 Tax=Halogeometricum limi TaxID=555875 RepID=A0A1I6GT55_9EURY|nr:thioredoxin family protein [Halogeometricum limi]SFR45261.1 thioredoxin [Halogeometricum limi]